tara:strand:+ start:3061 stop:3306 length:246 start_codon:yes stop_codon:yes gene_type:complete
MSNRTIVEFNHDFAGEISRDPEGFATAIRLMLNSGVNDMDSDRRQALRRFGIRTTPTHHHSATARVILETEHGREFWREEF